MERVHGGEHHRGNVAVLSCVLLVQQHRQHTSGCEVSMQLSVSETNDLDGL